MARLKTIDVFGVTTGLIKSYIERKDVDGQFIAAIASDKQIVIYGASKQGKTSLIIKHLSDDMTAKIQCSPAMEVGDVYRSILRQHGVEIRGQTKVTKTTEASAEVAAKGGVQIPLFAKGEAGATTTLATGKESEEVHDGIALNLDLPQDVSEALKRTGKTKIVVLDNFHYLSDEVQRKFAFDLRIFQELKVRFVILGIWRERNRLTQFNGDLQDRVAEIPVEPWTSDEFKQVASVGGSLLNVDLSKVIDQVVKESFDSIGVFQELCKECCIASGVHDTRDSTLLIEEHALQAAIDKKLSDYKGRHLRALEAFADSSRKKTDEGLIPLFIPYYFVRVLLSADFETIMSGLSRRLLHDRIKEIHHRPNNVRPGDMANFLNNIVRNQVGKGIEPPLFDYDTGVQRLSIIDSTLYFFLRHCEADSVLADIQPPSEDLKSDGNEQTEQT